MQRAWRWRAGGLLVFSAVLAAGWLLSESTEEPRAPVAASSPEEERRQLRIPLRVTRYDVSRVRPLHARRPRVETTIWVRNAGPVPLVPACTLSYGSMGRAKVVQSAGPAGPIPPGDHVPVNGVATFDRPLAGWATSEDAYCRPAS